MDVATYYADLSDLYRHYGGEIHGWHYGVWEEGISTHQAALLRSNECLLRDAPVSAGTRILDVGFGEGGFSVWAAATTGAELTGITICSQHIDIARHHARKRGVSEKCRFLTMDLNQLDFPSDYFDIVVNQETACYAQSKQAYIDEVLRILKPGGHWRNLDFSIKTGPLTKAESVAYRDVCTGFHLPSLTPLPETLQILERAGFEVLDARDLTAQVLPTAARIRRLCYLPLLMARLKLDWLRYTSDPIARFNRRGHIIASHRYSQGLERGLFRHVFCVARKPMAGPL